jgi:hypothetical protein
VLWVLVGVQVWIVVMGGGRGTGRGWEPYTFGEWGRDERWPT